MRRDAQALVARYRAELGGTALGRLDAQRAYSQGDMDLWFALLAFADNASIYGQLVRNGGNHDAAVLADRALIGSERRVKTAMQEVRGSVAVQNAWAGVRRQLTTIDTALGS